MPNITVLNQTVEMELDSEYLGYFRKIARAGQMVSAVTKEDLDDEIQSHRDGGMKICAEKTVEQLKKDPYAESFGRRLRNTALFMETTPAIMNSLGRSVAVRTLAAKSVVGACTDFTLEMLFFFGDWYKAAKLNKQNAKAAQELVEQANLKGCTKVVEGLSETTAAKISSVVGDMTPLKNEMLALKSQADELSSGLGRKMRMAAYNLEKAEAKLAKDVADEAALKAQKEAKKILADCAPKANQIAKLTEEVAERQVKLIELMETEKGAKKLIRWLDEVKASSTTAELQQRMQNKFGPSSHAAKLVEEARSEAMSRIRTMIEIRKRDITMISDSIPPEFLTPDLRKVFSDTFKALEQNTAKAVQMKAATEIFGDINKELSQNAVGEVTKKVAEYHNAYKENAAATPGGGGWGDTFNRWWNTLWGWGEAILSTAAALILTAVFCWLTATSMVVVLLLGAAIFALCLAVAWFFEWAVKQCDGYDRISASQIGASLRKMGRENLDARLVKFPPEIFNVEGQKALIKGVFDDLDPGNLPKDMDEATKAKVARDIKGSRTSTMNKDALASREGMRAAFHGMVVEALDVEFYEKNLTIESLRHVKQFKGSLDEVVAVMKTYEKELKANEEGFFDYASTSCGKIWNLDLGISWPEIATYLKIVNNYLLLILKVVFLVASMVPFLKARNPAILRILGKLAAAEVITSGTRMLVCSFGTLPCANAFAMDLVALQGIAFRSLIEGESVDVPVADTSYDGFQNWQSHGGLG